MTLYDFLVEDTELVIGLFVDKLSESLLYGNESADVVLYGVDDSVIGHSAFDYVECFPRALPGATVNNKVEPLAVVGFHAQECVSILECLFEVEQIFVDIRRFGSADKLHASCPAFCLYLDLGKIKAFSEIEVFSAGINQRVADRLRAAVV